ncbi:MAG TPA: flagellar hook capping FlgD N-terminal domain-containing protein [Candidatus Competibacteraceae bacterium]|nr:flagellar biosynthesis protein FlgD [Candidatus Competibacteraceae bacterium]MCP5132247.1 flagellar biosynthesis protein FlgD [Gammaproteobacteria bacterium]HPF59205.1 flagellar hook capping FlgD N-terminal domain-containing protein [Candidatus Competibacteraceae bacterium]HRY17659.1 flagellar hook capping FlgD N-terminal domain-containing protein [Candidatus Competibacteraceae bacterium]
MTTIQSSTATTASQDTTLPPPPKDMLNQSDFLELMIAQMKNQDPTKPLDGQEYLGQLAQFSTLNSIQELQKSFDTLAQSLTAFQTTQATAMVGKQALVESNRGYYTPGQSLEGQVILPADVSNLTLKVYSANGQLVNTVNMGSKPAGQVDFSLGSETMGAGVYQVVAEGFIDGEAQQFSTQIWNQVQSVAVGQSGQSSSLNLAGGAGLVDMNSVRGIR